MILRKTSTLANHTEIPNLHFVTFTLNTTVEDDSRQFIIHFAVAEMTIFLVHHYL